MASNKTQGISKLQPKLTGRLQLHFTSHFPWPSSSPKLGRLQMATDCLFAFSASSHWPQVACRCLPAVAKCNKRSPTHPTFLVNTKPISSHQLFSPNSIHSHHHQLVAAYLAYYLKLQCPTTVRMMYPLSPSPDVQLKTTTAVTVQQYR